MGARCFGKQRLLKMMGCIHLPVWFRMHNFSLSAARLEPQGCFPSEYFVPEGFYVKSVLGLKGTKQLDSLLVVGKDPFVF